jgi:hypothetical protein
VKLRCKNSKMKLILEVFNLPEVKKKVEENSQISIFVFSVIRQKLLKDD